MHRLPWLASIVLCSPVLVAACSPADREHDASFGGDENDGDGDQDDTASATSQDGTVEETGAVETADDGSDSGEPTCTDVGFRQAAAAWSLPSIAMTNSANDPMMNLFVDLGCSDVIGYSRVATVDLDGDARPDLVQTDDCGTGGLGLSSWDVYLNTGTGFAAEPLAWSLPPIAMTNQANDPMMNLFVDLGCSDVIGYSRVATVDLDGDARPDLVQTDDCGTGGLGLSSWDVYLNTGTGFTAEPLVWSLPPVAMTNAANDPMMNLFVDLVCSDGGYSRVATIDVDGDARPDLVQTDDCGTGGLGLSRWDVYLNTGTGFAAEPLAWSLPPIAMTNAANDPMMNLAVDLGCTDVGFSRVATVDLDGDRRPEIVQTDGCDAGGLGLSTWDVYWHPCSG